MSKVAVVFWSATGNTETMANCVFEGAQAVGAEAKLIYASEFNKDMIGDFDAIAFGCPAMGAEVLEEGEFQPMWDGVLSSLCGKKTAIFGSYDWGDGEWIRAWEDECSSNGLNLVCDFIMSNNEPSDEDKENLKKMGETLSK